MRIDVTVGYGVALGTFTYTGPDGKPVSERIRDVHVWRRESGGSWKVVIDIWNAEAPAAPAR